MCGVDEPRVGGLCGTQMIAEAMKLTLDISILNRVFNLGQCPHTPRSNTSTNLDLARSLKFEIDELSFRKVRSWDQEW
jgi:hypothetical protein